MAYDVHLEIFEGPLDLLLYLIRKNDLEISEIPIAQITTEYLGYLDIMKELNLEIAGDFLVMASTLMQIKARMLLPAPETDEDEGPDPLEELKAKLLEYQKFKEVSQFLSHKENEFSNVHYRPAPVFAKDDYVLEVSMFDLIEGFRNVLKELPKDVKDIVYQEIPIEQKIREILDLLEGKQFISFLDIFRLQTTRHALVVSFLAVLELIRLKQILACQSGQFGDIRIYRAIEGKPVVQEEGVRETLSGEGELGTADTVIEQTPVPDAVQSSSMSVQSETVAAAAPQEQPPAGDNEGSPVEGSSGGGEPGTADIAAEQIPTTAPVQDPASPVQFPAIVTKAAEEPVTAVNAEGSVVEGSSGEGEPDASDVAVQTPAIVDGQIPAAPVQPDAAEATAPQEGSPAVNNEKSPEEDNSHGNS